MRQMSNAKIIAILIGELLAVAGLFLLPLLLMIILYYGL